jgi:hypothetical protein
MNDLPNLSPPPLPVGDQRWRTPAGTPIQNLIEPKFKILLTIPNQVV